MPQSSATRRLPVSLALYRTTSARHRLPAVMGTVHLVMLGLGVMIGGGIFSQAGQQAASTAGPAVILSFAVGAVVCLFAALCYAELSSILPVAGSVYTFSYVAFGEVWAWCVGWALILELVVAAAVVARLFCDYLLATLGDFGVSVPSGLADYATSDARLNLLAPVVLLALTALIMIGARLTRRALAVVVAVKVLVILVVVAIGATLVDGANYTPFVPDSQPAETQSTLLGSVFGFAGGNFGTFGIFAAAGTVVFAYIGFDLIATAAEDARDARRSIPRGILISFGIVTLLYLAVAVVLVGLRPYTELGTSAPVVDALKAAGAGGWVTGLVGVGAMFGMLTVVLVVLIGQSRVLFSMGRDGLLPSALAKVSPGFNSPAYAAAVAGLAATVLTLYPKVVGLAQLLVIGALCAFFFSAVGVIVLRRSQPDLERGFTIPGGSVVPVLAALSVLWLGLNLQTATWSKFLVWMAIGVCAYLAYGFSHSRLATGEDTGEVAEAHAKGKLTPQPATQPQPTYNGSHRIGQRARIWARSSAPVAAPVPADEPAQP
jgi:APA family basic amino acid/polyamine antiporter